MPEVSIIIPTYDRALFVKEAIESVLKQTYRDFELIVVDDGSIDNTKELILSDQNVAQGDIPRKRIKYVYQENKGISSARNLGIKVATGRYISFLDSDDLWKREKLKKQVELMGKECKISYTDEIWMRNGIRINPKRKHKKYSGWIFDKVLSLCIISPSSCMIEKEIFNEVGQFDEGLSVCEDYDFWIRAAKRYKICLIEEPLVIKRGGHPDQLSKKIWGLDRFRIIALEKAIKDGLPPEQEELVIKHLEEKCRIVADGCLKRGRKDEAEFYRSIPRKYKT